MVTVTEMSIQKNNFKAINFELKLLLLFFSLVIYCTKGSSQSLLRSNFTSFYAIESNDSLVVSVGQIGDEYIENDFIVYQGYLPRQYSFLSINEANDEALLTIFPNPFNDQVTFMFEGGGDELQFSLLDITGKSVLDGLVLNGTNVMMLNDLKPGIYVFTYFDKKGTRRSEKIIKT